MPTLVGLGACPPRWLGWEMSRDPICAAYTGRPTLQLITVKLNDFFFDRADVVFALCLPRWAPRSMNGFFFNSSSWPCSFMKITRFPISFWMFFFALLRMSLDVNYFLFFFLPSSFRSIFQGGGRRRGRKLLLVVRVQT